MYTVGSKQHNFPFKSAAAPQTDCTCFPTLLMSNCRATPLGGFLSGSSAVGGTGATVGGCRDHEWAGLSGKQAYKLRSQHFYVSSLDKQKSEPLILIFISSLKYIISK